MLRDDDLIEMSRMTQQASLHIILTLPNGVQLYVTAMIHPRTLKEIGPMPKLDRFADTNDWIKKRTVRHEAIQRFLDEYARPAWDFLFERLSEI